MRSRDVPTVILLPDHIDLAYGLLYFTLATPSLREKGQSVWLNFDLLATIVGVRAGARQEVTKFVRGHRAAPPSWSARPDTTFRASILLPTQQDSRRSGCALNDG